MHSKVLKIGTVLLACVCLVSFSCLSVSAATDGYIDLPVSFNASWLDGYGTIQPDIHQGSRFEYGLPDGSFTTNTIFSTQYYCSDDNIMSSYNDFLFKVSTFDMICERVYLNFYGHSEEYEFTLDSVDGLIYYYSLECNNFNWQNNIFSISFVFKTAVSGEAGHLVIENMYYKTSDTSVIIGNQNSNTDREIQADKENTEQITDGWGGADAIDDSTANDFKDSESAALGGKTDEEIQAEVDNALNFDISVFDSVKVGKIHSLFDNLLDASGQSYQSLLLLSLTLGLAAFLIGRRYG